MAQISVTKTEHDLRHGGKNTAKNIEGGRQLVIDDHSQQLVGPSESLTVLQGRGNILMSK